jgi:hypothetical protein
MREVNIQPQSWAVVDDQEAEVGEAEADGYSFSYARA